MAWLILIVVLAWVFSGPSAPRPPSVYSYKSLMTITWLCMASVAVAGAYIYATH